MTKKKLSCIDIQQMKERKERLPWITAYDYWTARFAEEAGMDMILVGDSLGMCVYGYEGTVPVTMDQCICHSEAVRRGAPNTFIIGDMPFLSYQAGVEQAVINAGRFLAEGRAQAVKLEGGRKVAPQVRAIVDAGIPVQGHIGLTPQSVAQMGGFKVQGKTAEAAKVLVDDARALADAGCFSIVLEAIPAPIAARITESVPIPTIGIGAGPDCDGQVLVVHDVLGLFERFVPKFVKRYAHLTQPIQEALAQFREEVETGRFPGPEHTFAMAREEMGKLEE